MGARAGDTLKIAGGTIGVARAELSDDGHEGMIQIDGTCRSNCSAGLQEQVTVAPIEGEQAVAVRLSPLWVGAAPATIAPDRMLEDLAGADIESLCKKATLLAIAEFQEGTRIAPFIVLRSDFLAVLDSERGSPKAVVSS